MTSDLVAAAVGAAAGLVTGGFGPAVMARLPEPELPARPEEESAEEGSRLSIRTVYEKTPYAVLAQRPGLAAICAVAAALVGGLLGYRLGWTAGLAVALPLVPTGVWLGYVDARTTFLPTRIIFPTLALTGVLVLLAGLTGAEWTDPRRALLGCLLYGGVFYAMWWITPGFGFGDVRLAFLLGLALGFLGWAELGIGAVGGLFLGGFGGGLLALFKLIDPRRNPFGPYMLAAALIAACCGPGIADALGY